MLDVSEDTVSFHTVFRGYLQMLTLSFYLLHGSTRTPPCLFGGEVQWPPRTGGSWVTPTSRSAAIAHSKRQHGVSSLTCPAGGKGTTEGVCSMIMWHLDDKGIFRNPYSNATIDPNIAYLATNNYLNICVKAQMQDLGARFTQWGLGLRRCIMLYVPPSLLVSLESC